MSADRDAMIEYLRNKGFLPKSAGELHASIELNDEELERVFLSMVGEDEALLSPASTLEVENRDAALRAEVKDRIGKLDHKLDYCTKTLPYFYGAVVGVMSTIGLIASFYGLRSEAKLQQLRAQIDESLLEVQKLEKHVDATRVAADVLMIGGSIDLMLRDMFDLLESITLAGGKAEIYERASIIGGRAEHALQSEAVISDEDSSMLRHLQSLATGIERMGEFTMGERDADTLQNVRRYWEQIEPLAVSSRYYREHGRRLESQRQNVIGVTFLMEYKLGDRSDQHLVGLGERHFDTAVREWPGAARSHANLAVVEAWKWRALSGRMKLRQSSTCVEQCISQYDAAIASTDKPWFFSSFNNNKASIYVTSAVYLMDTKTHLSNGVSDVELRGYLTMATEYLNEADKTLEVVLRQPLVSKAAYITRAELEAARILAEYIEGKKYSDDQSSQQRLTEVLAWVRKGVDAGYHQKSGSSYESIVIELPALKSLEFLNVEDYQAMVEIAFAR